MKGCRVRKSKWVSVFVCLSMVLTVRALAADIGGQSFAALRVEVNRLRPLASPEKRAIIAADAENLTACGNTSVSPEDGTLIQRIYNDLYEWAALRTPGGFCIHLIRPFSRDLSVDEASDLLAASRMDPTRLRRTCLPRLPMSPEWDEP
jgi:hypothetical protein